MTKTYRINGKEIEELGYLINGSENIVDKFNSLLEALSDKEESKDLAFDDFLENKYGQREEEEEVCFNCGGTGIHTYEGTKQDWNKIITPEVIKKAAEGSNEDQRKMVGLEPKQEECKHKWKYTETETFNKSWLNNSNCEICDKCGYYVEKPKQPTSLKSEIQDILLDYRHDIGTSEEGTDKILKLLQSHLVKEIGEYDIASWNAEDLQQDIIKIINNL